MEYGAHYDTRNDTQRAEDLPKDFGHDNPEVIRLMGIREEAGKESNEEARKFSEFDVFRCGLLGETDDCYNRISTIDQQRPRLLADLFIAGGDFAKDDEEQKTRAELEKTIERYKLAEPVLNNELQKRRQHLQEVQRRCSLASQDVDALLAKLRIEHVAAMRR